MHHQSYHQHFLTPQVVLQKVELHALLNVVPVDGDVVVPVGSTLLVPEPGSVHQLVHYNP